MFLIISFLIYILTLMSLLRYNKNRFSEKLIFLKVNIILTNIHFLMMKITLLMVIGRAPVGQHPSGLLSIAVNVRIDLIKLIRVYNN
jgi:hypothetical protein